MMDNITLIHGDCLDEMKKIPDKSIDLVLTDPPYGIDLQPQRKKTSPIINDKKEDAHKLLINSLSELFRILKSDSHCLIFGGWSEFWYVEEIKKIFKLKSCIVWVKNNFGIGYYTRPQHEFIWYCQKGTPPTLEKPISDVIHADKVLVPRHSCEKSTQIIKKLLFPFSKKNDLVLDCFMGIGSVGVACKELNRNFIGIEINKDYYEIAKKRIDNTQESMF